MNDLPQLLPGDILLFDSGTFVDWCIKSRTWSDVAHIEVYLNDRNVTASRPSLGVNIYSFEPANLRYVRRPINPFNAGAALAYALKMAGTPYGYGDLGRFYLLNIPTRGLICSQYGDLVFDAAQCPLFADDYPAGIISPRDYRITPLAKTIWTRQA